MTYKTAVPHVWLEGSEYGPLMTNYVDYLCPTCGGYGTTGQFNGVLPCRHCDGACTISHDDPRVTRKPKESITGSKGWA